MKFEIYTSGSVKIGSLTVSQVVLPLAFISIAVRVVVDPKTFSHVIDPRAFVFRPVQIDECTLAVFFVPRVLSYISASVFESFLS